MNRHFRQTAGASDTFKRRPHPRASANIFEIITFSWLKNLLETGRSRVLEEYDLYATLSEHTSSSLGNKLEKTWKLEVNNAYKAHRNPSLLRALIQTFGRKFMIGGLIQFFNDILFRVPQPLLIGGLLEYFNTDESNQTKIGHAYICASCLTLSLIISVSVQHLNSIELSHCGMMCRVACSSLIYRKSLSLSHLALDETTVGRGINLLSHDVNKFDSLVGIHYIWIGPLHTIVITYFMYQEIGLASLIGVSMYIIFLPLQGWLGKIIFKYRSKVSSKIDEKLRLTNEIISSIELIKMYTWEKSFAKLVEYARKNEIQHIRELLYIKSIFYSFEMIQAKFQLFISILFYVLSGHYISTRKIFVIVAFYNILSQTMSVYLNRGISGLSEILVTIKRIQNFLLIEEKYQITNIDVVETGEKKLIDYNCDGQNNNIEINTESLNNFSINITNATAKWKSSQSSDTLKNVNLTVKSGELIAIVGPVGSGKSSLVQVILRELPLSEGNVSVCGVVSYASQEPWIFGGSVKQNIIFNSAMDTKRYNQVINICALKSDLEKFPFGDRTIVGERGVTLSGGQKTRISLARAVYKQADIYILDDPLSAVDSKVGMYLFEKCITSYLKEKTCILVTHQIQYLNNVNQIIVIKDTTILAKGSYQELLKSDIDFLKSMISPDDTMIESNMEIKNKAYQILDSENNSTVSQWSNKSISSIIDEKKLNVVETKHNEGPEINSFGHRPNNILISYLFASGSTFKVFLLFIIYFVAQILKTGVEYWIQYWVNLEEQIYRNSNITMLYNTKMIDEISNNLISRQTCIIVFTILILTMILANFIKSITLMSVCMKASLNLHNDMFNALTRATMYFLNTDLSGQILNRFSKDMGTIDNIIPILLMDCMNIAVACVGIMFIIGLVNVYLILPALILGLIFYKFRDLYLLISRSLNRLEEKAKSPVFAHLNTSSLGLITIRAFNAEQILSEEFDNHQDLHSSAWYLIISTGKAFAFWLDIICTMYVSFVTCSFLITDKNIYGGNIGLVITQAIGLTNTIQWMMKFSAELENKMESVERVIDYTKIPQESTADISLEKGPPKNWPQNGQILFKNFNLRYGPNLLNVLKNINIKIESMEKIGIVGRTGAGKSSIIAALFRLANNEGSIYIDDLDIDTLALHELRSKLSIIPQDPVLFSGTMRKNLDPFDEYPDHVLWNALNEVKLKEVIEDLPGGLSSKIHENGCNFSVGQKQLVCLARALMRNNKILVLDEATANVDLQTDLLIQNTIKNRFRTCTVLTIAHRLNTVMDSDKILVMEAGEVVEFDHPYDLLKNKNGYLYRMVENLGQPRADSLYKLALDK